MLWRPLLFSLGPSARGKIVAVSRAPRGNSFNHPPNIEQSIFVYYHIFGIIILGELTNTISVKRTFFDTMTEKEGLV